MQRFLILALCASFFSCGAQRKLSQVGLREPSSVHEAGTFTEVRKSLQSLKEMPAGCPKEVRELFPLIALEKVKFPPCPSNLENQFQRSLSLLNKEERTSLEEAINSQCRSLGSGAYGESFEGMLANFDSSGPMGRKKNLARSGESLDADVLVLSELRESLSEIVNVHMPLDEWVSRNGEFVLSDDELDQLNDLLVVKGCRMADYQVDRSYRTIRSLEELAKILKESDQKGRIERFLGGVHAVIEAKIKEYFYP